MIGEAISGKTITDSKVEKSDNVVKMLEIIQTLDCWIDEIEPAQQEQRFGNTAYRDWHARLVAVIIHIMLRAGTC
jgi:serine/threonine-protein phosphatase 2A activator